MSDWQKTTFGKVSTGFLSGGTPATSRTDYWKGEIPWITSKWLGDKLELTTGEKFVSEEAVKKSATKIVPKDSIIFATRVGVGKVGINRIDLAINQDLAGVLIDNEKHDIKFLAYQLGIDSIQQYVAMNKRGATIKGITRDCLEQIRLNVPPLPEQKKIAHILSTVQRAIEAQERIIQTTTELKKALMHKLFTEGLRHEPQKQTEIGPVPESWEVVDLGDVINLFAGYAFKSDEGISESNTQLLRMGNLYQNTLDLNRSPIFYPDSFAAAHKRFVLKEDDLVMSLTGTSGKEDYGFTVRIPKTGKTLLLNQRVTRIDVTDRRLQKDFAHHFLLSRKFLDHLYPTAKGMKQANLSTNAMKKLKVVLPGEAEQAEIATCFKSLDQKVVVAGSKVAALQDLFRTLLHELMTAKTRVYELEFHLPS